MTRRLVGFRLATRLARREVLRRPGRTLLVALLVAVPVAGMLIADVMVRTEHVTPMTEWRKSYGSADATVSPGTTEPGPNPIKTLLDRSRIVVSSADSETRSLRTVDSHRSSVRIAYEPMNDPMANGIVQVMSGRAPRRGNEVFLTRTAARQLGVGAGETLRVDRPIRRSFAVTGVGEYARGWGDAGMALPAGAQYPFERSKDQIPSLQLLVDFPDDVRPVDLEALRRSGAVNWGLQISPALLPPMWSYGGADAQEKVQWSWVVGALVLTIVGIVIASAFAIGARRQLVTIGQLAANGASPRLLRGALFLQGTWTGIVGAVMGVGLGAATLAALAPHVDRIFRRNVDPYTVRMFDLLPIILLGIGAATIAALVPARSTSRIPVLAALSGRRPLGKVPRWLPLTGACVSTAGLGLLGLAVLGTNGTNGNSNVWVLTAILGGVAVLLGACAIAPAYVSILEPIAARSHGSRRLAMRSLARQRTRTGAVVSAIAATAALSIAGSALILAAHVKDDRASRYVRDDDVQLSSSGGSGGSKAPPAAFVADAKRVLPGASRFQVMTPIRKNVALSIQSFEPAPPRDVRGDELGEWSMNDDTISVGIADSALIDFYGLSKRDQQQLAARDAVVLGHANGRAVLALVKHVQPEISGVPFKKFEAAMVDGRGYITGELPRVLVTPELAKRLGMTAKPGIVVLRAPETITSAQRDLLEGVREDAWATTSNPEIFTNLSFYAPPSGVDPFLIESLLVTLALVLVLFVVAVNLALSAAETRDERDVLTVVGAPPGSMRRANGYKAALLTAMGTVLAIPVGFLPVAVFVAAASEADLPLMFPSRVVLLLVVALPLVAGVVTTAASGISLRFRPVRISTMAYD